MSKIKLHELLRFYEDNLCGRVFRYEISNGLIINVSFYREQFCHLIGLQHIFKHDKRYLGANGYDKIKSEKLTSKFIKSYDKKLFELTKERMTHFDEILELMRNGELISFDIYKVKPRTRIQADFVIFRNDEAYILHLFLRKERENSNIYAPVSFVVKSINDKESKQYIVNQKYQKIVRREIIKK